MYSASTRAQEHLPKPHDLITTPSSQERALTLGGWSDFPKIIL